MPRVLITGLQPQHLTADEAHAWLVSELRVLRSLPDVESVVLTQVTALGRHPRPWDWVCELHIAEQADGRACAEHPVCSDWVLDLRLLGMRPRLAVLDAGEEVG